MLRRIGFPISWDILRARRQKAYSFWSHWLQVWGWFSLINLTELLHVELFSICLNANWHICIDKPSGRVVYLKFRVKMRVVELPDEWWAFPLKTLKSVGLQPFMSLYVYINSKVAPLTLIKQTKLQKPRSHQNCGPSFTRCVWLKSDLVRYFRILECY